MGLFLAHRSRRVFSNFKIPKFFPLSDFFEASSPKKKCCSGTAQFDPVPTATAQFLWPEVQTVKELEATWQGALQGKRPSARLMEF